MARLLMVFVLLACLALPATASAQKTNVPPGQSEADQYSETVPDGTGNSSVNGGKNTPEDVLSAGQLAQLDALGEDGAAAAALAATTSPNGAGGNGSGKGATGTGGPGGRGGTDGTGSPLPSGAGTVAAVPEEGGLGDLFWILIIGTGLAGIAYAVVRHRSGD